MSCTRVLCVCMYVCNQKWEILAHNMAFDKLLVVYMVMVLPDGFIHKLEEKGKKKQYPS
jgi:hypothetical protein